MGTKMKIYPKRIGLIKESYNLIIDENYIWFKPLWYNTLVKIEINTGEAQIIGSIPQNKKNIRGIEYMSCFKHNQWIILLPFYSDEICFYNILSNEYAFKTIEGLERFSTNREAMLQGHIEVGDSSYLFGSYSFLVKLDLNTFNITVLSDFKYLLPNTTGCFGMRGFEYNNKLILTMPNRSSLFIYNLDTKEGAIQEFNLEHPIGNFEIAQRNNKLYWLDSDQGKKNREIIEFNLDDEDMQRHKIILDNSGLDGDNILSIINEKIFLLPQMGQKSIKIDMKTWEACKIQNIPCVNDKNVKLSNYYGCIEQGNKVLSISTETEELVSIDIENEDVEKIKIQFEQKDYINYLRELHWSGNIMPDDLDALIEIVSKSDKRLK